MGCLRRDRNDEPVGRKQKWDYINLNDFKTRSSWSPIAYFFFFVNIIFGISVVAADCYTAVNLLIFDRWSSKIDPFVPFRISKWIFAGCIIFSFVLIGISVLWSVKAVKGGSIARGYLNVYAQRWYCFGRGGYKRFLVFTELTKSRHGSDYVMLFTYFSFKGWAQTLLADGPRQVLNGMTLYAVMKAKIIPGTQKSGITGLFASIKALEEESLTQAIILSVMLFTCVWWILTFLALAFAVLLWIMFVWRHVPSGHNLGSYCREKIDRRLVGIVAKNHKRTLEEEREERMKADQAGLGTRKPTLPVFGDAQTGPAKPPTGPTLPSINEKPPAPGLTRTNTTDTFTTTVSSRPDTNMPSRPPYAARPQFPMRSSTNDTAMSTTSSMFDDSASLLGGDRKDPFARTNTPLHRPPPPIGPYGRNYGAGHGPNSSQASLTNPYESAPLQPHDFLGSQQYLPPINRNDTVSPFYQRPPPVNRNDTISPLGNGPSPVQHRPLNFEPMQAPFPPNGSIPRRLPVRPEQNFHAPFQQPPTTHTPAPAPEFSKYTEHRHTPPIHHMPQSEVFEMDGGVAAQNNPPAGGAIELSSSPPKTTPAPIKGIADGSLAAHPMAFELDTGVPVITQSPIKTSPPPQTRTRRLTPPQPTVTPAPQTNSPPKPLPRQVARPVYSKPTYQPAGGPITSTSTPPPQQPAQRQLPQRKIQQDFEREEHGVGRNIHGNYDIEADVLDSYLHRSSPSQTHPQPPQPLQRPFMHYEAQGQQGSRPSTPTRGLPVRRESGDSYYSNSGALGSVFGPPARSMTGTPTSGFSGTRGLREDEFDFPERSMTAPFARQPDVRSSPPRGNSRIFENRIGPSPPRGPGPHGYGRNNGSEQRGYGGNNGYEQGGYGGGYSAW